MNRDAQMLRDIEAMILNDKIEDMQDVFHLLSRVNGEISSTTGNFDECRQWAFGLINRDADGQEITTADCFNAIDNAMCAADKMLIAMTRLLLRSGAIKLDA